MKLRKIGWSVLLVVLFIAFASTAHSWLWGKRTQVVEKAKPPKVEVAKWYAPMLSKGYTFEKEKGVFVKNEALIKAYYLDYFKACAEGHICLGPTTVEDAECSESQFGNVQATIPQCRICRVKQEYVDKFRGDATSTCPSGGFLFMSVTPFGFRCNHSFTSDQEASSVQTSFSCPSGYLKYNYTWPSGSGYNLLINCVLEELEYQLSNPSDLGMGCGCGYYSPFYALGLLDSEGKPLYQDVSAPEYVCGLNPVFGPHSSGGLEMMSPPVE